MTKSIVLALLALCQIVVANDMKSTPESNVLESCNYQLRMTATFFGKKERMQSCINNNFLATLLGCVRATGVDVESFEEFYIGECEESSGVTNLTKETLDSYMKYYDESAKIDEIPNFNKSVPLTVPYKLNDTITH